MIHIYHIKGILLDLSSTRKVYGEGEGEGEGVYNIK